VLESLCRERREVEHIIARLTGSSKPLEAPVVLDLAASVSQEIALMVFRAIIFLKPQWLDYTFLFSGPKGLLDDSDFPAATEEDYGCFDRTLMAYCAAYKVTKPLGANMIS
jgi:hypothetical protein